MKLSVIIPVYREKKTIMEIIRRVKKARLDKGIEKEIIVVDDGSDDGTREILEKTKEKGKNKGIKVFYHAKNQGKGSAIRTGLKHAKGDIIVIQDADLEYDPNDYQMLIKALMEKNANVVYGTRYSKHYIVQKYQKENVFSYFLHMFGNKFLTLMTNILYNSNLTDMETCYKAFRKEVLKDITLVSKKFEFEPEFTAKVLKKGHEIYEVPISYKARGFSEGKKIGVKDGLVALWCLVKYRFKD